MGWFNPDKCKTEDDHDYILHYTTKNMIYKCLRCGKETFDSPIGFGFDREAERIKKLFGSDKHETK